MTRVMLRNGELGTVERALDSTVIVRTDKGRIVQTGLRHVTILPDIESDES